MSAFLLLACFAPMCVALAVALVWHERQKREYEARLKWDAEYRDLMERWHAAEEADLETGGDAARLAVCRSTIGPQP